MGEDSGHFYYAWHNHGSSVNAQAQFREQWSCHLLPRKQTETFESIPEDKHIMSFVGGTHVDADVDESGPQGWVLAYLVFIYKYKYI